MRDELKSDESRYWKTGNEILKRENEVGMTEKERRKFTDRK